ncbi:MAG: glycosyltransferase family 2 protein [Anaerolineae bacterium]
MTEAMSDARRGTAGDELTLSLVIPVYNEEESLPRLEEALHEALDGLDERWEVLLIDDGSTDGGFAQLKAMHERDARFGVIRFRRNFGQTAAFAAGFDLARGDIVVTMDADLQNDPRDIPMILAKLREGDYDIVSGWRRDRQDAFLPRKLPSHIANWLISHVTGVHLHDYGCSLKAYRREVVKQVKLYGELHRFVPALASWMGVRILEVPVRHHARQYGTSKYGISRTVRVILDLLTVRFLLSYAARPMQIFGRWGLLATAAGVGIGIYLSALKLFAGASLSERPLLFLAILLTIIGIQFISMGLLAEIMVRVYHESQGKPIYAIRERLAPGSPSLD